MDKSVITNYFQGNYGRFYNVFLPDLKKSTASELKGRCPFHGDNDPSLSVNVHTGLFNCFGCGASGSLFDFYGRCNGLDPRRDLPKIIAAIAKQFCIHNGDGPMQTANTKSKVVARYDYQDQAGRVVYQIERLDPKSFRIRRSDENGGWIYKLNGTALIPYRLPEIIKNDDILIVEGEKDADNLAALGFTATTNPFGAGKWLDHFGPYFAEKNVVVIPDNDAPGHQHMNKVTANLKGHAASIKRLNLSDLPEKGDVSDYIAQFKTAGEAAKSLATLIDGAQPYEPIKDDEPKNRFAEAMLSGGAEINEALKELSKKAFTIKPLIPETAHIVVIYGPPGGGKTFIALDMGLHMNTARPYHGHKVRQKSVLYIAAEGKDGVLIRVKAWLTYYGLDMNALNNFHVLTRSVLIDDPQSYKQAFEAIDDLEPKPEIVFIDTVARSMIGDENSTKDMNTFVNACDTLGREIGAQIIPIHHTGKDESRGARGSVALTGATECMFKTSFNDEKMEIVMTCPRQKDQKRNKPMVFRAEIVNTGIYNADGDEYTSIVPVYDQELSEKEKSAEQSEAATQGGSKGLSDASRIALRALQETIQDNGEPPSDEVTNYMVRNCIVLPSVKVVYEGVWREHSYKIGITGADADKSARRQAFGRARKDLLKKMKIGTFDKYYWIVSKA